MVEMKDSNIRWIGQIPKNWKVIRVKDAFTRKKEKAKQENPVILSLARSGVKVRDITNNEGQLAENYSDYNPVMVDDLLLNPMDLISGDNCNISRVEGVISPAYVNLRYKKGINPEFYNFYFKYQYWCKAFFAHGKGVSFENRWTLNYDTLEKFPLILPPIEEQNRIVKFLKEKYIEIDALHTDIEKQIETLEEYKKSVITEAVTKGLDPDVEMKDSCNQYWKYIPKNWHLSDIKYLFEIVKRIAGKEGYDILSVTQKGLKIKDISKNEGQIAESYANYQLVYPTDFVMNHMDLLTGWVDCSTYFGVTSPDYRVFRLRDTTNNRSYYKYIMQCCYMNRIFYSLGQGVSNLGRWRLQTESFNNFQIPVPTVAEQKEIAEYLDKKCSEIDNIISDKRQQLETLNQYKKSLIYEYVTGKKEVK